MSGMAEREDRELWDPAKEIDRTKAQLGAAQQDRQAAIQAAGGYVVDPERAQGCIDELSRITRDIRFTLLEARRLHFDPPGFDEVSYNITRNGSIMAGRFEAFATEWANQVEATRDALQRQLAAYRAAEQANASSRA